MTAESNYVKINRDNLVVVFETPLEKLAQLMPAQKEADSLLFSAFGQTCRIEAGGITLDDMAPTDVLGILISLYARHAKPGDCIAEPFTAFKGFPDSMPYAGAFATHTQQILVPYVAKLKTKQAEISRALDGQPAPADIGGDFAIVVYPLPKIALCYIFYDADEDFPASVTCLYSHNANDFMPIDGLADVGEYTSKAIIALIAPKPVFKSA